MKRVTGSRRCLVTLALLLLSSLALGPILPAWAFPVSYSDLSDTSDNGPFSTTNAAALWHLNDGSSGTTPQTVGDATGNNNNGTLGADSGSASDDPSWTTGGRFGNALSFDGTDDTVRVLDSSSLDVTGDITLEAWIRPDADGVVGIDAIVVKTGAAGVRSYQLLLNNGQLQMRLSTDCNNWDDHTSSTTLSANVWYHVAGTRNQTD